MTRTNFSGSILPLISATRMGSVFQLVSATETTWTFMPPCCASFLSLAPSLLETCKMAGIVGIMWTLSEVGLPETLKSARWWQTVGM